ncbi:MAG: polyhydroxyalkanoic acid system family protein [Burkholderiales bacterium]|nr:polyhydroxyalkanoic acid system family protein [Burkholderiales bacterium]MDE1927272.1 polyhydroxyalkanoic acid system family protein [Burkholderiales bacterium]MDE2158218.1 polyhydroxyalkanoic acid system family protein [Burkholderiales bacterium]MDE2505527.1 polyhydroxyalkanoic acid system family protein [Burkholderiales bacterium]
MADIRIHREHPLGLARARQVAWRWAEQVEAEYGMDCTVHEGAAGDRVEFRRSGVHGRLVVSADHFDLEATLGLLVGAFRGVIEGEILQQLDRLLAAEAAPPPKQKRQRKP